MNQAPMPSGLEPRCITPTAIADRTARWTRLHADFARLPLIDNRVRDVGALLMVGHDHALAEAERYVIEGHTSRTGDVIEWDDIDDHTTLARWAAALDTASREGFAPPAPHGFWASFLTWRTPLGMARLSERRVRTS